MQTSTGLLAGIGMTRGMITSLGTSTVAGVKENLPVVSKQVLKAAVCPNLGPNARSQPNVSTLVSTSSGNLVKPRVKPVASSNQGMIRFMNFHRFFYI